MNYRGGYSQGKDTAAPSAADIEADQRRRKILYGGNLPYGRYGNQQFGKYQSSWHIERKKRRKPIIRKMVNWNNHVFNYLYNRPLERDYRDHGAMFPFFDYVFQNSVINAHNPNPAEFVCTRYVSRAQNRNRSPVTCVAWTPDGRRCTIGAHSGELVYWNGLSYNFVRVRQGHNSPVRSLRFRSDGSLFLTCDDAGLIIYWDPSFADIHKVIGHNKQSIRELALSPSGGKFATGSYDQTICVWDFEKAEVERTLKGHRWELLTVDWHPFWNLIVSGSKDRSCMLWDPRREGSALEDLSGHRNAVRSVRWSSNGYHFLSGSRDESVRLWDIRTMKCIREYMRLGGEINTVAWHPQAETLFAVGTSEGSVLYYLSTSNEKQGEILTAHDGHVWDLAWHPLGCVLASASNDNSTKFWSRVQPGKDMSDQFNVSQLPEHTRTKALQQLAQSSQLQATRTHGPRSLHPSLVKLMVQTSGKLGSRAPSSVLQASMAHSSDDHRGTRKRGRE